MPGHLPRPSHQQLPHQEKDLVVSEELHTPIQNKQLLSRVPHDLLNEVLDQPGYGGDLAFIGVFGERECVSGDVVEEDFETASGGVLVKTR